MNRIQWAFLACGLAGVSFLCLYPPWQSGINYEKRYSLNALLRSEGIPISDPADPKWKNDPVVAEPSVREVEVFVSDKHAWIFAPPTRAPQIAFSRLALEAGAVVGLTAVAVVLAGWRKSAKPRT